jgi:hypothetical protein
MMQYLDLFAYLCMAVYCTSAIQTAIMAVVFDSRTQNLQYRLPEKYEFHVSWVELVYDECRELTK